VGWGGKRYQLKPKSYQAERIKKGAKQNRGGAKDFGWVHERAGKKKKASYPTSLYNERGVNGSTSRGGQNAITGSENENHKKGALTPRKSRRDIKDATTEKGPHAQTGPQKDSKNRGIQATTSESVVRKQSDCWER